MTTRVIVVILLLLGLLSLMCLGGGVIWLYFGTNTFVEHEHFTAKDDRGQAGQRTTLFVNGGVNFGTNYHKPTFPGDPDFSRLPTTYYYPTGPAGMVLDQYNWFPNRNDPNTFWADARLPASVVSLGSTNVGGTLLPLAQLGAAWSEPPIAAIRLNTGTFAAYGRPFQFVDFYDRFGKTVPFVSPSDGSPPKFHYVKDAQARGVNVRIMIGDERPTLEKGPDRFYHALFVEITRSDLNHLATDLLTKEAMQMFMSRLVEDGLLCFHISHRHYDVRPVIGDTAAALGLFCRISNDQAPEPNNPPIAKEAHFTSEWAIVARRKEYLDRLQAPPDYLERCRQNLPPGMPVNPFWTTIAPTGRQVWVDGQADRRREIARTQLR